MRFFKIICLVVTGFNLKAQVFNAGAVYSFYSDINPDAYLYYFFGGGNSSGSASYSIDVNNDMQTIYK